jgi:hypothetical protein
MAPKVNPHVSEPSASPQNCTAMTLAKSLFSLNTEDICEREIVWVSCFAFGLRAHPACCVWRRAHPLVGGGGTYLKHLKPNDANSIVEQTFALYDDWQLPLDARALERLEGGDGVYRRHQGGEH